MMCVRVMQVPRAELVACKSAPTPSGLDDGSGARAASCTTQLMRAVHAAWQQQRRSMTTWRAEAISCLRASPEGLRPKTNARHAIDWQGTLPIRCITCQGDAFALHQHKHHHQLHAFIRLSNRALRRMGHPTQKQSALHACKHTTHTQAPQYLGTGPSHLYPTCENGLTGKEASQRMNIIREPTHEHAHVQRTHTHSLPVPCRDHAWRSSPPIITQHSNQFITSLRRHRHPS